MKRNIKHGLILFITLFLFVSNVLTESSDFFSLLSEIGNINNAEQDAVFAVGITPYTKSKTFKEINKYASNMAAVFINRQICIDVINNEVKKSNGLSRKIGEYKIVLPPYAEPLDEIVDNIELYDYVIYHKYFIGLYKYPGKKEMNIAFDRKKVYNDNPISDDDVVRPVWGDDEFNESTGEGESISLITGFYEAYENALLQLCRKLGTTLISESEDRYFGKEKHSIKKLLFILSEKKLNNVYITNIQFDKLYGLTRYRYKVFIKVKYFK